MSLDRLIERAGERGLSMVVELMHWRVIPVESLVTLSREEGRELEVLVVARSSREGSVMRGVLEKGVRGIVMESDEVNAVEELLALKEEVEKGDDLEGELHGVIMRRVTAVGMEGQVCVDTCALLSVDEGFSCGKCHGIMLLMLSEAAEVEYVPSRPFRVDAGPAHSYVTCAGGRNKYLVEPRSGDEVLVVDGGG